MKILPSVRACVLACVRPCLCHFQLYPSIRFDIYTIYMRVYLCLTNIACYKKIKIISLKSILDIDGAGGVKSRGSRTRNGVWKDFLEIGLNIFMFTFVSSFGGDDRPPNLSSRWMNFWGLIYITYCSHTIKLTVLFTGMELLSLHQQTNDGHTTTK